MTVLIDSWSWVEYFRGSTAGARARRFIEGEESALVSAVNVAEVYGYFLRHGSAPQAEAARRAMVRRCAVHPLTAVLAPAAAKIRFERGFGLGDAVVYATALATRARVVTGHPDFRNLPDVEFIGD